MHDYCVCIYIYMYIYIYRERRASTKEKWHKLIKHTSWQAKRKIPSFLAWLTWTSWACLPGPFCFSPCNPRKLCPVLMILFLWSSGCLTPTRVYWVMWPAQAQFDSHCLFCPSSLLYAHLCCTIYCCTQDRPALHFQLIPLSQLVACKTPAYDSNSAFFRMRHCIRFSIVLLWLKKNLF